MPKYDFHCKGCGAVFVERRPFSQASAVATCPTCQSQDTRKLFGAVTVFTYDSTAAERANFPAALVKENQDCCSAGHLGHTH